MLISLSTVLSFVKIFHMPLGGSVTLLSMVPVCLISVLYGTRYAVLPCFIYSVIQMATSGIFGWGLTYEVLLGSAFFDYLLPYTLLCLAGIFKSKFKYGVTAGVSFCCVLRFICHFLSGIIFFKCFDYFGGNYYIYSLCYNGLFMLPELILTVFGIFTINKSGLADRLKRIK